MTTVAQALDAAVVKLQCGRAHEAALICREILSQAPQQPQTLHLLGLIALRQQDHAQAVQLIGWALDIEAADHLFHAHMGLALKGLGRLDEAIGHYRQAVELEPTFAEGFCNLGNALWDQGRHDEAIEASRRAVALSPRLPEAHNNLANALKARGRMQEAIGHYQQAIKLRPSNPEALKNLGVTLLALDRYADASQLIEQAIRIRPQYPLAYTGLGLVHQAQGMLDEAKACYDRALEQSPGLADANIALANLYKDMGKPTKAVLLLRRTLAADRDNNLAWQNLLATLNYDPDADLQDNFAEHVRWGKAQAKGRRLITPHTNDRDPDRRLRVGYVSPDFKNHAVAFFFRPILAHHDSAAIETFCYAEVPCPDPVTEAIKRQADQWRNIRGLADEEAARMIRDDRIDILVDLAGHTRDNRLGIFALKPAPIAATFIGYGNTTGLEQMDYWLTDNVTHPPQSNEHPECWQSASESFRGDVPSPQYHIEELARLATGYICYEPPDSAPPVSPLPAPAAGLVTFGSLNNPAKINDKVIDLWSRVICSVPCSRLLLVRDAFHGQVGERLKDAFVKRGIEPDRISIEAKLPPGRTRIQTYDRIDIALDTFPYSGCTTTCEAMWMGVPVVTLPGQTFVSRMSASVLVHGGFGQLVATDQDAYVQIAASLAHDLDQLAAIRASLRRSMAQSPICDGAAYTRNLEAVYRQWWHKWSTRASVGRGYSSQHPSRSTPHDRRATTTAG